MAQNQPQAEVLIIGTMHDVPKIVKHSYKPLLKIAKKYTPDAIYVERQRPNDSLSLINYESKYFLPLGDSIAKTFQKDPNRYHKLVKTDLKHMSQQDFLFLVHHFAVYRDHANYSYYGYLYQYGIEGSKKPLRNENFDLTAPLGIYMNMKHIFSMDHQHETKLYTQLSNACYKESRKDGQIKLLIKHNKRDYRKHIVPSLLGRYGRYANRKSTIQRYVVANRFEFRTTPSEPCEKAAAVWDRRNAGMAKNIGDQMNANGHKKAIVIVGAGHVLGIKAELEKQYPNLKVRTLDD
ncbi:MAG: DUF5694 domain-containing protein [Bacteroidota bacterium]